MFYTYILYSLKLDKYYIGSTKDILKKIEKHNKGKDSKSTQSGIPWILFHLETYSTRQESMFRKKEIRSKNREYIESLV